MSKQSSKPTDAQTAKDLILWARKERIILSQLVVGNVSIVMRDLRLGGEIAQEAAASDPGTPARQSIYEQYGSEIMAAPSNVETVEPTIEDDDD